MDESGAWLENCNITPDSWQLRSAAETLNHSNKYSSPKIPSPQKCSHHPECLQIAVIMWYDWDTRHIVMSTSWHQHQLPHQMLANNILILRNKIWDSWLVPDDPSPKSLMEHTDYNWINLTTADRPGQPDKYHEKLKQQHPITRDQPISQTIMARTAACPNRFR